MKSLLATILVILSASIHSYAVTVDELARFLGVTSWESTVGLSPGSYTATVYEFADGKVGNPITLPFASDKSDGPNAPILVMWKRGEHFITLTLTLSNDSKAGVPNVCRNFEGISGTAPKLQTIKDGDYVVAGEPVAHNGVCKLGSDIADYKRGILLRISKNP